MRACWGPDPVEHDGPCYRIPPSRIGPKPFRGTLPVLIGGLARPAVVRAARLADGFVTAVRDWDTTRREIDWYREAGGTGRVVIRVLGTAERGVPRSVIEDLARADAAGADEVVWDLNVASLLPHQGVEPLSPARQIAAFTALAAEVGLSGAS
jgi:alkanesulfonate monooxygenase SsuD/methylene tetrahydromethanopterin reductase-like flavin-dependent oxidoreductase (luciferase family)